jgi:biofilm PGA synthesis N-glycosyltransferase PgaC
VPETIRGLWRQRLRWSQGGVEVLRKHRDIWRDWRQRRLWPVYLEYVLSVAWSYIFWTLVFIWVLAEIFNISLPLKPLAPIPPAWTGLILALTCLIQFVISLYVDHVYDQRMLRYLFWVIWYPFMYWMITSLTVIVAAPKAFLKKKGTRAVWQSPDRGIDSSKLIRRKRDA